MRTPLISLCVILLAGCGKLGREMTDMNRLRAQLATEFQRPVGINIMNGKVLSVSLSLPDSAHNKMGDEDRQALSLRVARFARSHYADADSLDRITVVWVSRGTYGPLNVSHTYRGGSWSIAELTSDTNGSQTQ
jgi:hypothetical protein